MKYTLYSKKQILTKNFNKLQVQSKAVLLKHHDQLYWYGKRLTYNILPSQIKLVTTNVPTLAFLS